MQTIRLDSGQSLLDIFNANVCCRDLRQSKPNAEIFLSAAAEFWVESAKCRVVGDAPPVPRRVAWRRSAPPEQATQPHCGWQARISW